MSTERHEAAHCAACLMLGGRPVERLVVEPGFGFPGEEIGRCTAPIRDEIGSREIVVGLVGYLAENALGWPPPYAEAREERRESLGLLIRRLKVDEECYEELIQLARDLLLDEDFRRLQATFARALAAVPVLEAADIETLARVAGGPIPEEQEQANAA